MLLIPAALDAQEPSPPPLLRAIHITGAREIGAQAIQESLRIKVGDPLMDTPERIGERVSRQYHEEGYTFARVNASFDAVSGELTLDIEEGAIGRRARQPSRRTP